MTKVTEAPGETTRRRGRLVQTLRDLYHERTKFDFIGRAWRWGLLSGLAVVISIAALGYQGLNLGIDFTGGRSWTVKISGQAPSTDAVRDVLRPLGLSDAKVIQREDRATGDRSLVVQADEDTRAGRAEVRQVLERFGEITEETEVSATWGETVTEKALVALGVFFVLIAAYLTFRFEWKMAVAAIVAVVHDIVITVGVYAVTQFEVVPATVVAFLTILGFSLYDTVVVFDKIKENESTLGSERGDSYSRMVNRSLNQVLMRSLNTSFVALLPVASLLVVGSVALGAVTLRAFALALFVGLLTGAYSSIFVATPVLAWLKEREPRYAALRERSAAQLLREDRAPVAPAPAAVSAGRGTAAAFSTPTGPSPSPAPRPAQGGLSPRPRQQRRRKRR